MLNITKVRIEKTPDPLRDGLMDSDYSRKFCEYNIK